MHTAGSLVVIELVPVPFATVSTVSTHLSRVRILLMAGDAPPVK